MIGIGNPDRGDDGFGPEVASRLEVRLPAGVRVLARGGDLLDLVEDWAGFDAVVCVDSAAATTLPGRIHRIDAGRDGLPAGRAPASSHALGLAEVLRLARALGSAPEKIVVYAVEGESFEPGANLTPAVASALDAVAERVAAEVARLQREGGGAPRNSRGSREPVR